VSTFHPIDRNKQHIVLVEFFREVEKLNKNEQSLINNVVTFNLLPVQCQEKSTAKGVAEILTLPIRNSEKEEEKGTGYLTSNSQAASLPIFSSSLFLFPIPCHE
jgi:Flp pilus assembly protein CpaB